MLLAKVWYFLSSASTVFLLPYLYLFFRSKGFSDAELGAISALRPWFSGVAGFVLPVLADRLQCHKALMLVAFSSSVVLRLCTFYAATNFYSLLLVMLSCKFLGAPVGVLADAMVVASSEKGGGYGRQRLWASVGWGGLSYPGGVLLDKYGFGAGFLVYAALSVPSFLVLTRFTFNYNVGGKDSTKSVEELNRVEERASLLASQPVQDQSKLPESATGIGSPARRRSCSPPVLSPTTPFATSDLQGLDSQLQASFLPHPTAPEELCLKVTADGQSCPLHRSRQLQTGSSSLRTQQIQTTQVSCCTSVLEQAFPDQQVETAAGHGAGIASDCQPPVAGPRLGNAHLSSAPGSAHLSSAGSIHGTRSCDKDIAVIDRIEREHHEDKVTCLLELVSKSGVTHLATAKSTSDVPTPPPYHIHVTAGVAALNANDGAASLRATPQRELCVSSRIVLLRVESVTPPQPQLFSGPGSGTDSFMQRAGRLLSSGSVWLFLAKVFLLGFGAGVMGTWLLIYMSSLGASHALMGLMLTVNCVAEVPVFHFQEKLTSLLSTDTILQMSLGTLLVRLMLYALLPSLPGAPWVVLSVELLHGITFALCWGASCVHCKVIAPPDLQATMQGLMQSVYGGFAGGSGGLVGALLHERLGGRSMWLATTAIIALGWALVTAIEVLLATIGRGRGCKSTKNEMDQNLI